MSSGHQALLRAAGWASSGAPLPRSMKLCYDELTIIPSSNGLYLELCVDYWCGFFSFCKMGIRLRNTLSDSSTQLSI